MNFCIYVQRLVRYYIDGLMCTAHLLPLLCPLLFIINARNKCLTLALIVIMESDDSGLFFDSLAAPYSYPHLWDEIRT